MNRSTQSTKINRPSLLLYLTEGFRAIIENLLSFRFRRKAQARPEADDHPVMVIPGFLTSDLSTVLLRKFLNQIGYQPFGWGLGLNMGGLENEELLLAQVDELYNRHRQKISLIGWSLGGVYAREIAKKRPHLVRQVITMGSPFGGITEPNNATWIYNLLHPNISLEDLDQEWLAQLPDPAPVPTTALYSKRDGIVNWQVCMENTEDALHQNIQVDSSHLGFGGNETVLRIIADRLQYKAENWQIF